MYDVLLDSPPNPLSTRQRGGARRLILRRLTGQKININFNDNEIILFIGFLENHEIIT